MKPLLRPLAVIALSVAACARTAPAIEQAPAPAFNSSRISVVTRGNGPDIILIPGLSVHRDDWGTVSDRLDDRYRLHLVQVNGFAGFAAGSNADGAVAAPVAEEIARYIRGTGLSRPAIIGHSMGGTIGMMLTARHPGLVGRLMVVDMMPYMGTLFGPPGATAESLRAAADQFRARIIAETPGSPNGTIEQMFANMTRVEAMRPVLLQRVAASDRRTVANAFHELIVTDLRPELARVTAPVTVLYVIAPNAPLSPDQFDAAMRELYANARTARLIRIEDSNHFIQLDQPDRFLAEVDSFMRH
jgi:pimeloyl-ACP methyl ester carboxylesterase